MTTDSSDGRPELDKIRERLDAAMGALRILGRECRTLRGSAESLGSQVRALRAEVEALRGEPK